MVIAVSKSAIKDECPQSLTKTFKTGNFRTESEINLKWWT